MTACGPSCVARVPLSRTWGDPVRDASDAGTQRMRKSPRDGKERTPLARPVHHRGDVGRSSLSDWSDRADALSAFLSPVLRARRVSSAMKYRLRANVRKARLLALLDEGLDISFKAGA